MCFDYSSLAGKGEVARLIAARVQLGQIRDNVGGGEIHSLWPPAVKLKLSKITSGFEGLMIQLCPIRMTPLGEA